MSPTSYHTAPSRAILLLEYCIDVFHNGAEDRNRTGTVFEDRRILSPVRLPVPPPRRLMAPRVGLEPTTYRLTAGCSTIELPRNIIWQRPTLPGRLHPSTIGAERLNFCVRYGNRCVPLAIITRSIHFQRQGIFYIVNACLSSVSMKFT